MHTPMRTPTATPDRTRRGPRRAPLAALALLMLLLLVLRSPVDVLATLATVMRATTATGTAVDVPRADDVGRVTDDASGPPGEGAASTGSSTAAPEDGAQSTGRWGDPAPRPTREVVFEELRGTWRVERGIEEAVALAVLEAHRWAASEAGVPPGGGGAIVTVEAVERPGAHHGVVTLLVAAGTDVQRIAVPVRLDTDGPALAGAPWRLPAPDLRTLPITGQAIGDSELVAAAERALERAGIVGRRLTSLDATDGWPFIARLDDGAEDVWLRWHVDRFVVSGLPLDVSGAG